MSRRKERVCEADSGRRDPRHFFWRKLKFCISCHGSTDNRCYHTTQKTRKPFLRRFGLMHTAREAGSCKPEERIGQQVGQQEKCQEVSNLPSRREGSSELNPCPSPPTRVTSRSKDTHRAAYIQASPRKAHIVRAATCNTPCAPRGRIRVSGPRGG